MIICAALLGCVAVFASIAIYKAADPVLTALCLIAFVLALGFLGLLLK